MLGEASIGAVVYNWVLGLSEKLNVVRNLTAQQSSDIAKVFIRSYPDIKLTELAYFFDTASTGRYGKLFDHVDIQVITEWFKNYLEQAAEVRENEHKNKLTPIHESVLALWKESGKDREEVKEFFKTNKKPSLRELFADPNYKQFYADYIREQSIKTPYPPQIKLIIKFYEPESDKSIEEILAYIKKRGWSITTYKLMESNKVKTISKRVDKKRLGK